jgi:hypothetical protein
MDFALTEDQILLKETVRAFAEKHFRESLIERDEKAEFDAEGWKKLAEFGIFKLPIPEAYGGLGKDAFNCLIVMEALGYGCPDSGLLFAAGSHLWTCEIPILTFGTDAQKAKYLPDLSSGALIGGHAMTEPDSGSDAFSIRTKAVRKGDVYILNGAKTFISNAPIADVLVVFASTDKDKGFAGISAFIVEKGFPGYSVGRPLKKMGLKTSPTSEVILQDCVVPVSNRLGPEGAGSAIFNAEMDWERSCLFGCHLGALERQLERCIEYSKTRHQFGQPIGKFQSISHKIADMKVRLELARLILYKVAWSKSTGQKAPVDSAIAKLFLSEAYVKSSLDAIQIHGGYGYMAEFGVEKDLRDAVASRIYSGTSEIQKNVIASWLGL